VRAGQLGGEHDLALEPSGQRGVVHAAEVDGLDGDLAIEADVAGSPDPPHAAGADLALQAVAACK